MLTNNLDFLVHTNCGFLKNIGSACFSICLGNTDLMLYLLPAVLYQGKDRKSGPMNQQHKVKSQMCPSQWPH